MKIIEYRTDLIERDPVPTESLAYRCLSQEPVPEDTNYIASPWAYLINKNIPIKLPKNKAPAFTVCQHIHFEKLMPALKRAGVTLLFSPHCEYKEYAIEVRPFPHFAICGLDPAPTKDIFYSFVGFEKSSNTREKIFNMAHPENAKIIRRNLFHFSRENDWGDLTEENQMAQKQEFQNILARSRFSLCPRGTGAGTLRFWESLQAGAIPVLLSDNLCLYDGIDWNKTIIRIPEADVEKIPTILESISKEQEDQMRANCLKAYQSSSGRDFVKCIRDYYNKTEKIGTDYGGWRIPKSFLKKDSICYCAGAGEDISFDVGIVNKHECDVHIFDPTPKAISHYEELCKRTKQGKKMPINNNPSSFYDVSLKTLSRLHWSSVGLSEENKITTFYMPKDPGHVSASIDNLQKTKDFFRGNVKRLSKIMEENNHKSIDLLKLDIEGAEYGVIDTIIEDGIRVGVLCLEFHNNRKTKKYIRKLIDNGFSIINKEKNVLTLFKPKIKLYSFYTPSHKKMLNEYFLPSLKDDYEIILEECDQQCRPATFMENGWMETMVKKVDLIIKGIRENWGRIFIHSDVDMQFFNKTEPAILKLIKNKDMAIQRESPSGTVCPGFLAIRGNEKTLRLWRKIRDRLISNAGKKNDQDILNDILILENMLFPAKVLRKLNIKSRSIYPNTYGVKWTYLPDTFFSTGISSGKLWYPGDKVDIPKDIVIHHANWTEGADNKIALLNEVRSKVDLGEEPLGCDNHKAGIQ